MIEQNEMKVKFIYLILSIGLAMNVQAQTAENKAGNKMQLLEVPLK
jgi:hypothetical protein